MTDGFLTRLLEHNNWANSELLDACEALADFQLDFQPQLVVRGTIRDTLQHLVTSQEDYAWMATKFDHPPDRPEPLSFTALREVAARSGQALVSLASNASEEFAQSRIELTDGYKVELWVFIVQAINHATEHREQIKGILTSLGIEPPKIDGWRFGRRNGALIPPDA